MEGRCVNMQLLNLFVLRLFLLFPSLPLLLPATPRLPHNDDRDAGIQSGGRREGRGREGGEGTIQYSQWHHGHSASLLSIQSHWALCTLCTDLLLCSQFITFSRYSICSILYFVFLYVFFVRRCSLNNDMILCVLPVRRMNSSLLTVVFTRALLFGQRWEWPFRRQRELTT